jgi:hypothetical protein
MKSLIIFHEGKSIDKDFFKLLIKDLKKDEEEIEFYGMGAKSNFFKKDNINYQNVILEIEEVKKILFIIDSDNETDHKYGGFDNTLQEIKKIQETLNIKDISDTFIAYDMRSTDKSGYLESLILSSLSGEQNKCIEAFLDNCPEFKGKNNHKSIFNVIFKKAYPDTKFNFGHPNFNVLKEKIAYLFESE